MVVASPPSSLTTGRYSASPFQNYAIPGQQPPYKYSSSLPSNNNNAALSTPPFSTGLPFPNSFNNSNNNLLNYVGTASTASSNSNSSASSSGSTPFNYIISPTGNTPTTQNYSTTPSNNPSPFSNNIFPPSSNYSTPPTSGHTPTTNPHGNFPNSRPRSISSAAPLSTTPPFSIPPPNPMSASVVPTLARSNSVSSKVCNNRVG